jgi:DNA repair protein RadC
MPKPEHPGSGHRARLRDKFLAHGLGKFTDAEVLELLLTLATPRRDCKQAARDLLAGLGSLSAVLEASPERLAGIKGVGPVNILGLKLVPAVARRYLEDRVLTGQAFDAARAADYLVFTMRPLRQEVFRVMLLDGDQRVLAVEELSRGTLDQAVAFPREVVARALEAGASGRPKPSAYDRELTRTIYFACRTVGLELADHLIVGSREIYSFADQGDLMPLARQFAGLNLKGE